MTFEWSKNGTQVAQWLFYVGTAPGTANLHNSGVLGGGVTVGLNQLAFLPRIDAIMRERAMSQRHK